MDKEYILSLFKDCDFNEDYDDCDGAGLTSYNFDYRVLEYLPDNFSYKCFSGVSKLCIIPEGADYVIKIPFKGNLDDENDFYYEFENANETETCWDYCLTELLYYQQAKHFKVEKAFCKTKLLGYINDYYPIYVQQRAEPFENKYSFAMTCNYRNDKTNHIENTKDYCASKLYRFFNDIWLTDALEYYGKAQFDKIMSFIEDCRIRDLHSGNLGYIGARPVIIDFSDYVD
jgi:hypothetical protein